MIAGAHGTVGAAFGRETHRITLGGEIDAALGEVLDRVADAAAAADDAGRIEVDVGRVTFMDSTGLAFISRLATASSAHVRLLGASSIVRTLLEITGIDALVDVEPADDGEHDPGLQLPG